ncbi:MAG: calcium-binding protein [Phycisphaerae bacterium]|nr:calcium-binding protein [Phycisphaerae bacterium]
MRQIPRTSIGTAMVLGTRTGGWGLAAFAVGLTLAPAPMALAGPPTGACCYPDGSCGVTEQTPCTSAGGTWTNGADCDTTGSCEVDGDCLVTIQSCCNDLGGTFNSGGTCNDDGCQIFSAALAPAVEGVRVEAPTAIYERIRAANAGRGGSISAVVVSNVLQITGTSGMDSIRLSLTTGNLRVQSPEDGSGQNFLFPLASFNSINVALGDQDDLIVFDDSGGQVAPVKPYTINAGDGADIIIARTGTMTLAQVLTVLNTLNTANTLMTQADAIRNLAGAVPALGTGSDVISNTAALLQSIESDFITPASVYLTDVNNLLIQPSANAVNDVRTNQIAIATAFIDSAHLNLILAGQALHNSTDTDLRDAGLQLVNDAQTDLQAAAAQLEACGVNTLLAPPAGVGGEAQAFADRMNLLADQIEAQIVLCPEKGAEPPEQPNGCPQLQELMDCMEREMEDFIRLVEICADQADDLEAMADDLLVDTEAGYEATADTYELDIEAYEALAESFENNDAANYEAATETYIANLEAALEGAGNTLDAQAQTVFEAAGAQMESDASTQIDALAGAIASQAAALSAQAETIMSTATDLLEGTTFRGGPANGDCTQIVTTNTITGGIGPNFLLGGSTNDLIDGLGGPDLIIGGAGDDRLNGGDGIDIIFGGADTNEIHGNDGIDILIGGNDVDCIYGEADLDLILGRNGDDQIDSGEYVDVVLGGNGNDQIFSRDGIDVVLGEGGNDRINAGDCIDVVLGGNGDDTIIGGDGQVLTIGSFSIDLGDVLFGGVGRDTIYGDNESRDGTGIDVIFGGDMRDSIYAADGGDMTIGSFTIKLGNLVFGGLNDDIIESKKGIDVIFGQAGDDTITTDEGDQLSLNSGNFTFDLGDLIFGGDGNDTIDSDTDGGVEDLDLVFCGAGNDTVRAYDGGTLTINSFSFLFGNLVFGRAGNDTITCEAGLDLVFGGTENDTITVGDGALLTIGSSFSIKLGDLVFAGDGADTVHCDTANATDGTDGEGIDIVFGGPGGDIIWLADGGEVTINTESFEFGNLCFGGTGNDVIRSDYATPNTSVVDPDGIDLIFGGPDNDTINAGPGDLLLFGTFPTFFSINFGNIVFGGTGDDNITVVAGLDLVFCGPGNDIASTGNGIDLVFGGTGDDTLTVGDGGIIVIPTGTPPSTPIPLGNLVFAGDDNDTIDSDGLVTEIDLLFGGKCNDTILCGNGLIDLAFGGPEDDLINGEQGIDLLFAGRGSDTVNGGDFIDLIFGSQDPDTLNGDDGIDLIFGGRGKDAINGNNGIDICFGNLDADTIHGNDDIDLLFGNRGGDDIFGDNGIDLIFGGKQNDCVYGGSDLDIIFGGDGNDLVEGQSGLGLLFGNQGDDTVNGGIDLDMIFGGPGVDSVDGAANVDLVFGGADPDIVRGGNGLNLLFGGASNDVIIGGADLDLAFGNDSSDFLYGGGGLDLLFGGSGNDTIYGEAGLDLAFGGSDADDIDGGPDGDIILGNSGNDRTNSQGGRDIAMGNNDNDHLKTNGNDGVFDALLGGRHDDTLDACQNFPTDVMNGGPGSDTKNRPVCDAHSFGTPARSTIAGRVLLDTNFDAIGDAPAVGVTVFLDLNNNGALNGGEPSTVTTADDVDTHIDEGGAYRFTGRPTSSVAVRIIVPSGLTALPPGVVQSIAPPFCATGTVPNFVLRDSCLPNLALPNPCEACACPPGFEAQLVTTSTLQCADGSPCTGSADCACGGACVPVVTRSCDCVPISDCPAGATLENEASCGPTSLNSGCDAAGNPQFSPISCGETICGTMQNVNASLRDTDSYFFVAPSSGVYRVCITPDLAGRLEVFTAPCGSPLIASLGFAAGPQVCLNFTGTAGTAYRIRVSPSLTSPCENYLLTLLCPQFAEEPADQGGPAVEPVDEQGGQVEAQGLPRGFTQPPPQTPSIPGPPHDAPKNRYVSLVPNNFEFPVAIEIIVPPCRRGYVGTPVLVNFSGVDAAYVADVVENPVYRRWSEPVVHVRGCTIAPERSYDLTAETQDGQRSATITISTVVKWGDVAGATINSDPNGIVDQVDVATVSRKQTNPASPIHTTRCDLAPLDVDYFVSQVDVGAANQALSGGTYPPPPFGIADIVECDLPIVCANPCGDSNCDGFVTVGDIGFFVQAIVGGQTAWSSLFGPGTVPCDFNCVNDTNGDGFVSVGDISAFVNAIVGGACN